MFTSSTIFSLCVTFNERELLTLLPHVCSPIIKIHCSKDDHSELDNVTDLIWDRLPNAEFTYSIPENRNDTIISHDDGFVEVEPAVFSKLLSETESYQVEIKSSDALNSIEDTKKEGFGLWMAGTFGPMGIAIIFLRRH